MRKSLKVYVVNDGSKDAFKVIFDELQKIPNVVILQNAINIGKGAALKHGINHILNTHPETVGVITADADGQHLAEDIIKVLDTMELYPENLILGYREFDKKVPLRSAVGNRVSRVVYKFLLGLNLKDTQTGLRGIPISLCKETLKIKANKYELETEQLILASKLRVNITEVPITTVYENDNSSSHFNPFLDSVRIYYALIRYTFSSLVTALTDFIAFIIISGAGVDIIVSNLASRYIALLIQFFLLSSFVFRSKAGIKKLLGFFVIVSITGLISGTLQKELSMATGISIVASKVIVDSTLFLFNFLFLRDILFRPDEIEE